MSFDFSVIDTVLVIVSMGLLFVSSLVITQAIKTGNPVRLMYFICERRIDAYMVLVSLLVFLLLIGFHKTLVVSLIWFAVVSKTVDVIKGNTDKDIYE